MWIAVVVLSILCIVLGVFDFAHKQNAKSLKCQVEYLKTHETNAELTVEAPDKEMEGIFRSINELLRVIREKQIACLNKELNLRKHMSEISHDLRTPLTSILGYIELAKDATLPEEERQEYLAIVERRANTLQQLVTGVYELSRIDEERYLLEEKPVQVNQVLYDVLALYYNEFENRGYVPDIQIEEELGAVLADRKAMLRIYSNIMQNVLRHGKKFLHVSVKQRESKVVTIIQNDSEDINEKDLPNLFERFYMADRIRTGENTGLGLAIVKSLTEHMGGQVEAIYEDGLFGIRIVWNAMKSAPHTP